MWVGGGGKRGGGLSRVAFLGVAQAPLSRRDMPAKTDSPPREAIFFLASFELLKKLLSKIRIFPG